MSKPIIVISGINMTNGGLFTILDNCLKEISLYNRENNFVVYALVADENWFKYDNICFLSFPKSKKSWWARLFYEYFYFKKLSIKLNPDVWLSLHDTTPNVICKKQFVYCHNPNSFQKIGWRDWFFDYKVGVFGLFYKYLYKINIKKNSAVFVQQYWIKHEFEKMFNIDTVFVATPPFTEEVTTERIDLKKDKIHFFYPSFPRHFKNFEVIMNAILLLDIGVRTKVHFVFTTINGNKNRYAKHLMKKYSHFEEITFLGHISRNELLKYYNSTQCLLFPSKLETWGLPISEAKAYKKPILLANLPYAKETVGDYDKVSFFDPDDAKKLADLIADFANESIVFDGNKYPYKKNEPLNNWFELFDVMLK
jgi:glycosyltransferase involved in cell wall biosynthesis